MDTLAIAQAGLLFWSGKLAHYLTGQLASDQLASEAAGRKRPGTWLPPRVSESQAVDQAGAMVDRFNRIFLRTLRALRDLRRYAPPVIVQNAGQVNVASQQVNLAARAE